MGTSVQNNSPDDKRFQTAEVTKDEHSYPLALGNKPGDIDVASARHQKTKLRQPNRIRR